MESGKNEVHMGGVACAQHSAAFFAKAIHVCAENCSNIISHSRVNFPIISGWPVWALNAQLFDYSGVRQVLYYKLSDGYEFGAKDKVWGQIDMDLNIS